MGKEAFWNVQCVQEYDGSETPKRLRISAIGQNVLF